MLRIKRDLRIKEVKVVAMVILGAPNAVQPSVIHVLFVKNTLFKAFV